ncbi:MAG: DNA polymerase ligase N-terminal domain-containing protein [Candidatus Aenigmarchaeota archaeon]
MPRFVIHKHHARRLHYDLRLEMAGVLKSWAVPKEPPKEAGVKRLAIRVEDHKFSYIDFEGIIPEGMYGAGKVEIWDSGTYRMVESKADRLVFEMKGKKLKGTYCLVKFLTKEKKPGWLFFRKSKPE